MHQRTGCGVDIAGERFKAGEWRGLQIGAARFDHGEPRLQQERRFSVGAGVNVEHGMSAYWFAAMHFVDRLTPPSVADVAKSRRAHRFGAAGDLIIERVKNSEPLAYFWRRKATREPTILIDAANGGGER